MDMAHDPTGVGAGQQHERQEVGQRHDGAAVHTRRHRGRAPVLLCVGVGAYV